MRRGTILIIGGSIGVCLGVLLEWYRNKRAWDKEMAALNEFIKETAIDICNRGFFTTNDDSENTDLEGVSDN